MGHYKIFSTFNICTDYQAQVVLLEELEDPVQIVKTQSQYEIIILQISSLFTSFGKIR